MADKKKLSCASSSRPTSPHLQIYRWNISSFTSILHRATGVALYFSILAISWYIVYYAYQIDVAGVTTEPAESCDCPLMKILNGIFCAAAAFIIFALYYHATNGIRHLFWDMGKGFEKSTAKRNGIFVIIFALLTTAATIGTALYFKLF